MPWAGSTAVRERTYGAMLKDSKPVPQPISKTSKEFGVLMSGRCSSIDFRARELASWTEGFESHDAASALNRSLPVSFSVIFTHKKKISV